MINYISNFLIKELLVYFNFNSNYLMLLYFNSFIANYFKYHDMNYDESNLNFISFKFNTFKNELFFVN